MERVQRDRFGVIPDSFLQLPIVAVGVAQVVVALDFLRIDLQRLLVVGNRLLSLIQQVLCIRKVVVNVTDVVVNCQHPVVVLDCCLSFTVLILRVGDSNQCL